MQNGEQTTNNKQIKFFTSTFIPMVKRACQEQGKTYTSDTAINIWNQLSEIPWMSIEDITQQTINNRIAKIGARRKNSLISAAAKTTRR